MNELDQRQLQVALNKVCFSSDFKFFFTERHHMCPRGMIFAVPAGLIGSGLTDAMDEEKREKELDEYRVRMRKSFRRIVNKTLRGYMNTLPDGGGEKLKALNFVPQRILLIAYRMANMISQQLDSGRGIQPDDIKDFKDTGFGYSIHE